MAISNLTGTEWLFNETLTWSPFSGVEKDYLNIVFNTDGHSYGNLYITSNNDVTIYFYNEISGGSNVSNAYKGTLSPKWKSESYRTITFVSGTDLINSELISWVEANATQIIHDVKISYKGSTITATNTSGTITLDTAGTYLEDDIEITYTKPNGTYVGGTVAWNQIINIKGNTKTDRGITASCANGLITLSNTSTTTYSSCFDAWPAIKDHIYIRTSKIISNPNNITCNIYFLNTNWNNAKAVNKASQTINTGVGIYVGAANTNVNGVSFYANIFDLTVMFGSTIADYVYSLENDTEGTGIAWLKANGFFNSDYYPYDEGSLLSINSYGTFAKSNNENVVGNFEMNSNLELRGIPKLDASNNLYYDGDTYDSNGTVTRNYGIVDLGTLSWVKPTATDYMNFYSTGIASVVKSPSLVDDGYKDIRCSKYSSVPVSALNDRYIYINTSGQIRIKDTGNASLTADEFKTAMNGVYLVYELATPTTENAKELVYIKRPTTSYLGANPVKIATYAPVTTYLKDTAFTTWTPSTTALTLSTTANVGTAVLDLANYDYCIVWTTEEVFAYNGSETNTSRILKQNHSICQSIYKNPGGLTTLAAKNYNTNRCTNLFSNGLIDFYNQNSVHTLSYTVSVGIYPTSTAATFSNSSSDTPTMTVKTPVFKIACNSSYLSTANAGNIDANNTYFKYWGELWRVDKDSTMLGMYKNIIDAYNA